MAEALRRQAERLGVHDRLHYAGLLAGDEVRQALADADLLVMPSESESFGNSAAEALAAGLPILVSDRVPVGRWAEAAGAGRRVAPSAAAFVQAAREMLVDPDGLRDMGERGRELAQREFDLRAVALQMLRQCSAIVETGRPLEDPRPGSPDPGVWGPGAGMPVAG
jgi:glycosyltransferase involved in cell wall biosynthesis